MQFRKKAPSRRRSATPPLSWSLILLVILEITVWSTAACQVEYQKFFTSEVQFVACGSIAVDNQLSVIVGGVSQSVDLSYSPSIAQYQSLALELDQISQRSLEQTKQEAAKVASRGVVLAARPSFFTVLSRTLFAGLAPQSGVSNNSEESAAAFSFTSVASLL